MRLAAAVVALAALALFGSAPSEARKAPAVNWIRTFGATPARARQCLSDPKGLERLLNITKAAEDSGINHTPTFLINGKVTDATTWEQLEPLLKSAAGG